MASTTDSAVEAPTGAKMTAAKKASPKKAAAKKAPVRKATSAKAPAKPGSSAVSSDIVATPWDDMPADKVVWLALQGEIQPEQFVLLSLEAQALLAIVLMERRRKSLFDANGTCVVPGGFQALVAAVLSVPKARAQSVMVEMRKAGAYTTAGRGAGAKVTFRGTKQANAILDELDAAALSRSSGTPGNEVAVPASPPPSVYDQVAPVTHRMPTADAAMDTLAEVIATNVWRESGYSPVVVERVVRALQSRLF